MVHTTHTVVGVLLYCSARMLPPSCAQQRGWGPESDVCLLTRSALRHHTRDDSRVVLCGGRQLCVCACPRVLEAMPSRVTD